MAGKQPTPQGISALLRKAGFDKSVSSASRIRGMKESSPGYQVSRGGKPGTVMVEFRQSSFRINSGEELAAKMLARYRETIEAAGFTVDEGKSTFRDILIISTATDPDAEEATPNGADDKRRIRITSETYNFSRDADVEYVDLPDGWDLMTHEQRDALLNDYAMEALLARAGSGACVVDENDEEIEEA